MKVIGAGFGRTGTMSLKIALEQLGFDPCYHMIEVIKRPQHVRLWQRVADGEQVDWSEIFANFEAGVDYPISNYYRELIDAYPEAKVILSVREPERWYESTLHTIYQMSKVPLHLRWLLPPLGRYIKMTNQIIWDGLFGGRLEDKAFAIQLFEEHIEEVQRTVPSERLLIFRPRDGWEPLCAFLEVPVPEGRPFPHVNERKMMQGMLKAIGILSIALPLGIAVGLIGVIGLVWRWLKHQDVG